MGNDSICCCGSSAGERAISLTDFGQLGCLLVGRALSRIAGRAVVSNILKGGE
jgi:hypothetical protein